MIDQRGQPLRAAVGFAGCSMRSHDRALWALRTWLDSWPGIGHVAVGMHRQGYDLQLTQYDERGWRATFYTTGMEHSPNRADSAIDSHPTQPGSSLNGPRAREEAPSDLVKVNLRTPDSSLRSMITACRPRAPMIRALSQCT